TQGDAVIEVRGIRDHKGEDTARGQNVPRLRAAEEKGQAEQTQREQRRPAEQVELQQGQQLVRVGQAGRQGMPSMKADAVAKAEVVRRIEDRSWQQQYGARELRVVDEVQQHE